ncbi:MAG: PBS lyase [Microcoleus sp. SU_5_3]|nr:PBS lyase [Microcoleus sp. SU_5_3]
MDIIGASVIGLVGFLTGVVVAYWLAKKRLNKQKKQQLEQTRRITEEIEIAQLSRLQQTVESQQGERESQLRQAISQHENQLRQLAADYENQLRQVIADRDSRIGQVRSELEETHNSRLQETLQSLEAERERQLLELAEELHQNYQAQIDLNLDELQQQHEIRLQQTAQEYHNREVEMQSTVQSLQEQYESQLRSTQEQLRTHEAQMQATIESLQQQYENKLKQQEVSPQLSQSNQIEVAERLEPTDVPQQLSIPFHETEVAEQLEPTDVSQQQSFQFYETEVAEQLEPTDVSQQAIQFARTDVAEPPQITRQALNYSVAQLMGCVQSQDAEARKLAAFGLGRMAAANALRSDSQRAIETLGKLTQDSNSGVRHAAVEALGMIKSEKVIPLLQKALRDTDGAVTKSASAALNKFKFYPRTPAAKPKNVDVKKPKR